MRFPLYVMSCVLLLPLTFVILITVSYVNLFGFIMFGNFFSVLSVPGYLFPFPGQGNFQPLFLQIVFLSLSLFSFWYPILFQRYLKLLNSRHLKIIFFSLLIIFLYFYLPDYFSISSVLSNLILIHSSVFLTFSYCAVLIGSFFFQVFLEVFTEIFDSEFSEHPMIFSLNSLSGKLLISISSVSFYFFPEALFVLLFETYSRLFSIFDLYFLLA